MIPDERKWGLYRGEFDVAAPRDRPRFRQPSAVSRKPSAVSGMIAA